ncbi:MAG: ABC transporter ATP-binding protein [Peptostreptococcaceae bacterium]|nr:ABC transporter ATP-binding protein [Peptostreptococcaceae bacterium]
MLKKLIQYYKPHKKLFFMDFGCAFLTSVMDLFFPAVVSYSINRVLPMRDSGLFFRLMLALFVFYAIRFATNYVVHYIGHIMGTRIEHDMRRDLFNHIQSLSFKFFDNTRKGKIISGIVNDLNDISEFAHHVPEDVFIVLTTVIGSFFLMTYINLHLTIVAFVLIPVLILFTISKNIQMKRTFRKMREKIADVNSQLDDSISGIKAVKAFANEDYEMEKFARGNQFFKETKEEAYKTMAEYITGVEFIANLISLLLLAYGGYLILHDQAQYGDVVGFLLYVNILVTPIRRFATTIEIFQKGMTGFERFYQTMEIKPDIEDAADAIELEKVDGKIEFQNISFAYDEHRSVIEDLSLSVTAGEQVALVGPSGAGKTTLFNLVPRFYNLSAGKILIDGKDIEKIKLSSLRDNIGLVQQDVVLFAGTVKDNILYAKLDATDEEIREAARLANALEFIEKLEFGFNTYVGERGVKLSGGQKQRLAIARIFLKNPPILILDEATSSLDNESEKLVQDALYELSKDRTTLVIAHRLSTIKNADRIIALTEEGIVEEGTHKELLAREGIYASLYKLQFREEDLEPATS